MAQRTILRLKRRRDEDQPPVVVLNRRKRVRILADDVLAQLAATTLTSQSPGAKVSADPSAVAPAPPEPPAFTKQVFRLVPRKRAFQGTNLQSFKEERHEKRVESRKQHRAQLRARRRAALASGGDPKAAAPQKGDAAPAQQDATTILQAPVDGWDQANKVLALLADQEEQHEKEERAKRRRQRRDAEMEASALRQQRRQQRSQRKAAAELLKVLRVTHLNQSGADVFGPASHSDIQLFHGQSLEAVEAQVGADDMLYVLDPDANPDDIKEPMDELVVPGRRMDDYDVSGLTSDDDDGEDEADSMDARDSDDSNAMDHERYDYACREDEDDDDPWWLVDADEPDAWTAGRDANGGVSQNGGVLLPVTHGLAHGFAPPAFLRQQGSLLAKNDEVEDDWDDGASGRGRVLRSTGATAPGTDSEEEIEPFDGAFWQPRGK